MSFSSSQRLGPTPQKEVGRRQLGSPGELATFQNLTTHRGLSKLWGISMPPSQEEGSADVLGTYHSPDTSQLCDPEQAAQPLCASVTSVLNNADRCKNLKTVATQ